MSENFTPLLPTYDWNIEWKLLQKQRRSADDSAYWDKRAKTFSSKDAPNPYVEQFIKRSKMRPDDTLFDMGCGTGALSVPLGLAGHAVIAADFSQGMLDIMKQELAERGIRTVTPILMSWEDDWEEHGVTEESVDVAIASRSIATSDMKDSLLRLHSVARRRICITLSTGSSPRMDGRVLEAVGVENVLGRDYQYAVNILMNEGIHPEVSYIESARKTTYGSFDEAFSDLSRMVSDACCPPCEDCSEKPGARRLEHGTPKGDASHRAQKDALERLHLWLGKHLVENPQAGTPDRRGIEQKELQLDIPHIVTWAFISWDK